MEEKLKLFPIIFDEKEILNLILNLEELISHIWAEIPLMQREAEKYSIKIDKLLVKIKNNKSSIFSNYEQSLKDYQNKLHNQKKIVSSKKSTKDNLNESYLKLCKNYYKGDDFMLETSQERYERWCSDLIL